MSRRDEYRVQVDMTTCRLGWVMHIKVERVDGNDGIPWDDLQEIKNEVAGVEHTAIEFYPAESELVNEKNMRHLWVIEDEWLPFGLGGRNR
jgi:hypothetical protein